MAMHAKIGPRVGVGVFDHGESAGAIRSYRFRTHSTVCPKLTYLGFLGFRVLGFFLGFRVFFFFFRVFFKAH